ncbi:MAG TPA: sigma-54 factor interaction domain-containing protein [Thermoanaerobacterales bacterium]|nr:sigma-54 factor interaction domain-containing protein [Thermoanaerobacterales bacterium]
MHRRGKRGFYHCSENCSLFNGNVGINRNFQSIRWCHDGGTIFLDEIVELPLTPQAKLLHVLQNRSFTRVGVIQPIHLNIRIITATNRNLEIIR